MSIFLVIVILIALIVVHEFGHFIVAKIMGVRVNEFGIGYPPRAYTLGKIGDTEYTLNWLPFGGFVRLFGEDSLEQIPAADRRRSFSGASRFAQAVILIAGVAANVLFAWGLFTVGFMAGMPAAVSEDTPGAALTVGRVLSGSPAENAGLITGDRVIGIVDEEGELLATLTPTAMIAFVAAHGGESITVSVERRGETFTRTLTPAHAVLAEQSARPAIGIELVMVAEKRLPFLSAITEAFWQTLGSLRAVVSGIYQLINDAFRGAADLSAVVGPVGLVTVVGDAADYGWTHILGLAAFISVNLAIINLIPIPALDGGRLVFVGLEALTRRATPKVMFQVLNLAGFSLIVFLMIAVTYNDIARLIA
jgi:regulator of sigma E protease